MFPLFSLHLFMCVCWWSCIETQVETLEFVCCRPSGVLFGFFSVTAVAPLQVRATIDHTQPVRRGALGTRCMGAAVFALPHARWTALATARGGHSGGAECAPNAPPSIHRAVRCDAGPAPRTTRALCNSRCALHGTRVVSAQWRPADRARLPVRTAAVAVRPAAARRPPPRPSCRRRPRRRRRPSRALPSSTQISASRKNADRSAREAVPSSEWVSRDAERTPAGRRLDH